MKLIDKIDKNKMMRLLLLKKKTPIRLHDRVLIEHNPEGYATRIVSLDEANKILTNKPGWGVVEFDRNAADAIVKYLIPLR